MRRRNIVVFSLLLSSFCFADIEDEEADRSRPECRRGDPPSKLEMIQALDDNGDDKLSPAEATRCLDCRLKCFCNGMKKAFNLEENQPDYDGDGLFDEYEIPDPPDDAPFLPSEPPSARQILKTVDRNRDNKLSQKELRACLRRYCGLNCPCKQMLRTFRERAGSDNKLSIDEFHDPGEPCAEERDALPEPEPEDDDDGDGDSD